MIVPSPAPAAADVAEHYDELSAFYLQLWGPHVHHGLWDSGRETPREAVELLARRVARRAAVEPASAVCDVGCGYGATARLLVEAFGARVTALTISAEQAREARRLALDPANPRILLRDWLNNGLPDRSFDAVIAIESTEHMANKAGCFEQAFRVLRPGGRCVVCAWLAREDPRDWEVRRLLEPICREGRLAGLGTSAEYAALMQAAGLTDVDFEDLSRRVSRTWSVCLRRAATGLLTDRRLRRFVLRSHSPHRQFARCLGRIRLAYATGSLRYGLFTARRPA